MLAFLGFVVQHNVMGKGAFENLINTSLILGTTPSSKHLNEQQQQQLMMITG